MKAIYLFFFLVFYNCRSQGQDVTFLRYKLEGIGYISIPSNMEVQSGRYKEVAVEYQKAFTEKFDYELSEDRIVFQPKGVNELNKNGLAAYARIIIETEIGSYGEYEKLSQKLVLTPAELKEVSENLRTNIKQQLAQIGIKIIDWYGVSIVTINGINAVKISYLRQLGSNPNVYVNIYKFMNNDRMHSVTLSYRTTYESTWKPILGKVIQSFKITNIR